MSGLVQKEGWKHRNVFETYLLLGPSRTIPALAKATGISPATLFNWSKSFDWNKRLEARDQKAMEQISAENDKLLQTVIKKRHQEAYQAVQEKALSFIEKRTSSFSRSKSPMKDAAIALDVAVKGERDVLGLRDTKVKGALVKEGLAALIEMTMSAG